MVTVAPKSKMLSKTQTHSAYNLINNNNNSKLWLKLLQYVIKDQGQQITKVVLLMQINNYLVSRKVLKITILLKTLWY